MKRFHSSTGRPLAGGTLILVLLAAAEAPAEDAPKPELITVPQVIQPLTEPPCSYCSTQHRKRLINDSDLVLAWIRGAHNGGAIPVRHFLAGPRVINDTYGLFFYDPDGDYVAAYKKDYGYKFYGWRRGVMVVQGRDGTLWSALTGRAFDGPQKGQQLERVPSLTTEWAHWLMLHPESTAYDLFDGQTYKIHALPEGMSEESLASRGVVDPRLPPETLVLGIESGRHTKAFPLDETVERACVNDSIDGQDVSVFWYGPTGSAVAYRSVVDGRKLTFRADAISPETAPFKDEETGTRWTLAGRGVDGPLKGQELTWMPSIQCRWFAWSAEYPETDVTSVVSK